MARQQIGYTEWPDQHLACTQASAAPRGQERQYPHPDAEQVGEGADGRWAEFRCPHCGITWRVEYE